MSTPVLSKKQQKRALSGKKGPAKGLRNVLAQPYEFFWPILKNNSDELKLLMKTTMPAVKRTSPNIPWSKLHRMKKAERQIARNEARLKLEIPPPDENIVKSVVMGVNEITRLLEKDDASCVLLEANVDSMCLIKHIVIMAEFKNIPCIIVPFLKSVMVETVSIGSVAVALKKIVADAKDHHFHELYKKVAELAASLQRSKPLKLDFKELDISSTTVEETPNIPEKSNDKREVESDKLFTISKDVYKYRNSRKERVFVPKSSTGSQVLGERSDSNFISVGKDLDFTVSIDSHERRKTKTRYVDIHEEDNKVSSEMKDDRMQLDEYISMDLNPECSVSSDNEICDLDDEILYKKKPTVLGIAKKNPLYLKDDKPSKKDTKSTKNFKYQSLKVKRLQGNSKRVKATKIPKKNQK